jgi:hypothetical protein
MVNGTEYTNWLYDSATCELAIILEKTDRRAALEIAVQAESAIFGPKDSPDSPFVGFVDYDTLEDARNQVGTVIIAPTGKHDSFDAEIEWKVEQGAKTLVESTVLKGCNSRQILHAPFADDGGFSSFRWGASVRLHYEDQSLNYQYQGQDAYPSINRWQMIMLDPVEETNVLKNALVGNGNLDATLPWQIVTPTPDKMLNLRQPFGVVLLQDERYRISNGEALEACLRSTIVSPSSQEVMLALQYVGEHTVYLDGIELSATAPIQHMKLQPMFYSWMPAQCTYYALPLQAGENALVVFTRPTAALGWWGIGATLFDHSGEVVNC